MGRILITFFICIFSFSCVFGEQNEAFDSSDIKKISKLIKGKKLSDSREKFVAKNISYEYKDILPEVEKQNFIRTDGVKVWLELTNFEFLVNSKESNKLVKIYIGNVGDKTKAGEPIKIEIFDPEAAFVFQDAIIHFWEKLSEEERNSKLAEALHMGYSAVSYYFGFSSSLRDCRVAKNAPRNDGDEAIQDSSFCPSSPHVSSGDPGKNILNLQESLHRQYEEEMQSTDRLVTKDLIEKRKTQGFVAYYSNPIYFGDMALYLRPMDISYEDYVIKSMKPAGFEFEMFPDYKGHDKYSSILERLYPGGRVFYGDENGEAVDTELRRVTGHVFRSDNRSIDDIFDEQGFWPKFCSGKVVADRPGLVVRDDKRHENYCFEHNRDPFQFFSKDSVDELLDNDMFLRVFYKDRIGLVPLDSGYISFSKEFNIARKYGHDRIGYTYAAFLDGGIIMASSFVVGKLTKNKFAVNLFSHEIAAPGGIDWDDIVAARKKINLLADKETGKEYHFVGPVFLKFDLIKNDKNNFWKILYTMGDKWKPSNSESYLNFANDCMKLRSGSLQGFSGALSVVKPLMSSFTYDDIEKDREEAFSVHKDLLNEFLLSSCNEVNENLTSYFNVHRR